MWEREAPTAFHTSDKLFLQYDRTVQQNNLLIEVYVVLKLKSKFLGFTMFLLVNYYMLVKLWEGWKKLHVKDTLRLSLEEHRVFSGDYM